MDIQKHSKEIRKFVADGDYELSDGGILIHSSLQLEGWYEEGVNGGDYKRHKNLLTDVGIAYILNAALSAGAVTTSWYITVFGEAFVPAGSSTISGLVSGGHEISNPAEGYSGTVRLGWTPTAATSGTKATDNYAAKAAHNIVTTTTVRIGGAGLVSSQNKGASTGTLVSATKFGSVREVVNGDVWECGYKVTLADS